LKIVSWHKLWNVIGLCAKLATVAASVFSLCVSPLPAYALAFVAAPLLAVFSDLQRKRCAQILGADAEKQGAAGGGSTSLQMQTLAPAPEAGAGQSRLEERGAALEDSAAYWEARCARLSRELEEHAQQRAARRDSEMAALEGKMAALTIGAHNLKNDVQTLTTEKASLEASLEAARAELQVRADVVADLNAQREADAAACKQANRSVRELEEANAELERRRDSLVRALDDMQGSHMKVVKAKLDSVFVRAFPNEDAGALYEHALTVLTAYNKSKGRSATSTAAEMDFDWDSSIAELQERKRAGATVCDVLSMFCALAAGLCAANDFSQFEHEHSPTTNMMLVTILETVAGPRMLRQTMPTES